MLDRKQLLILTIGSCLGAFLVSVDSYIINVALPTIAGYLGIRTEISIWLLTLFTMPYTIAVPLSGRLCGSFGNKPIFLTGLIIFTLGCALCAFAHNFQFLLLFRIIQGLGAGMIIPSSVGMLMIAAPAEKRSVPMSIWALFVMVGPAMGPVIGGLFSNVHWHWLFFISIPFATLSFFAILITPFKEKNLSCTKVDWVGLFLLMLFVGSVQVVLNRGQLYDWFHSKIIVVLTFITIISIPLFVIWETFCSKPLVYVHLFKKRNFTIATVATGVLFGSIFSTFTLDILWSHEIIGYPPSWAGLALFPVGILPLIVFPFSPWILKKLGPRNMSVVGSLIFACTFFWEASMNRQITFSELITVRFIQGIGFPLITLPNAMMVIDGVENKILSSVISFYQFARMFMTGIGVSVGMILWIHRQAFYQTRIASHTYIEGSRFISLLKELSPVAHSTDQLLGLSYEQVQAQASTLALADIYYLYGWLAIGVTFLVCCFKTKKVPDNPVKQFIAVHKNA
ncbi:MAG: Fatty acid resistance protein FarB [Chlamydiales bacterium]|nr:Fatty acid resistance protein FarB [Chlamydiales bacterium]MCH9619124.1 Fatty acid resistance protein FarB [Chlamydiales bacterium]MCH9622386.1 Fatty acid resistance protein FarB [Chlamydiales bacterium]